MSINRLENVREEFSAQLARVAGNGISPCTAPAHLAALHELRDLNMHRVSLQLISPAGALKETISDSHQPHFPFIPTARLYSFEVSFLRYGVDVRLRVISKAGVIGISEYVLIPLMMMMS